MNPVGTSPSPMAGQSKPAFLAAGSLIERLFSRPDPSLGSFSGSRALVIDLLPHGIGGSITTCGLALGLKEKFASVDVICGKELAYRNLPCHALSSKEFVSDRPGRQGGSINAEKVIRLIDEQSYELVVFLDSTIATRQMNGGKDLELRSFMGPATRGLVYHTSSRAADAHTMIGVMTKNDNQCPVSALVSLGPVVNIYDSRKSLAEVIGVPFRPLQIASEADAQLAREMYGRMGISSSTPVVYLHSGTSTPLKELTGQQWGEILRLVSKQIDGNRGFFKHFAIVISPGDAPKVKGAVDRHKELAESIQIEARKFNFGCRVPQIVIAERGPYDLLAGLVKTSCCVICADTVVLHSASAQSIPCCSIFSNPIIPPEGWSTPRSIFPKTTTIRVTSESLEAVGKFGENARSTAAQLRDAADKIAHMLQGALSYPN